MDKALAELIEISREVGKDSALVQGGGGNTSVKTPDGNYMYIKASGTALKDMDERKGWRRLDLNSVREVIKDKTLAGLDVRKREAEVLNKLLLACDDNINTDARPSVEAHLHAFLDNCVIHLHSVVVGSYVNAKTGKAEIEKLFKNEKLPPLWVPYADPGFTLAAKTAKLVIDYEKKHTGKPQMLFMEKHGVFVSCGDAKSTLNLVHKVIEVCTANLKLAKSTEMVTLDTSLVTDFMLCIRKAYFDATGQYSMVRYFADDNVARFTLRKDAPELLSVPSLTPDETIYANGAPVWIEKCDSAKLTGILKKQIEKESKAALSFIVKGVGLFIAGSDKRVEVIRQIVSSTLFIRANAIAFGGVVGLTKKQQDFILGWEAEAFRMSQVESGGSGELNRRISIVTGAGSGLGRSLAVGLARAGAAVGIADIDTKAASETAEFIKKELPEAQTLVLGCNVTDEAGVTGAFKAIVDKWGGLDILVNAAGVAPAYPLVDMPVDKWRFALEVNLTGYFLMAREAAKIMIKQGIGGCIINLSSKSGVEASKNNTAYNATKAGELHMARGWALELGDYGIRVNSICPGNVFEGSKIWNPEYIKVCAKKYGIKPQEVIPYYVNKTALKLEIKGQDIADSVVFLCSNKARTITGQMLIVDSGQVMAR